MNVARMESGCVVIKAAPAKWSEQYDSQQKIKTWGSDNLYPQRLRQLLDNSPTGAICVQRYADFIKGRGIVGGDDVLVNEYQSVNDWLSDAAENIARFGGFATHLRYDGAGEIIGARCLDVDTLRLGEDDDLGYFRNIKYCPDWSGLKTRNGRDIDPDHDVVTFFRYSDSLEVTLARMGERPEEFDGEVLLVSNREGYPMGVASSVATPLSTDEGVTNTCYRNARTSFACGGMVTFFQQSEDGKDGEDKSFREQIAAIQGDENTGSLLAVSVNSMEEAPKFVPFEMTNYDAKLEKTAQLTESQIYSAFKQDAFYLLKLGKIGFGGDVLADAYNVMNLNVRAERAMIERTLKRLAKRFPVLNTLELKIQPLVYSTSDGGEVQNTQQL